MKSKLHLVAICFLVSGCATQGVSTFDYKEPMPVKVKNEITVNKPYSQVWDKLVKELSKSFYVINNIDKESRIINLSFMTNAPVDYIDCGRSSRTYTHNDKTEKYDYDTAGSYKYKLATDVQPNKNFSYYYMLNRDTSLEGRANIYIAPSEKDINSTVITVNTRYIFSLKVTGNVFAEHFGGNIQQGQRMQDYTDTIMFNTNAPGKSSDNGVTLTCCSKGKLENEILGMIQK